MKPVMQILASEMKRARPCDVEGRISPVIGVYLDGDSDRVVLLLGGQEGKTLRVSIPNEIVLRVAAEIVPFPSDATGEGSDGADTWTAADDAHEEYERSPQSKRDKGEGS